MDLPDPYLPGAISLFDQLDKRLMVVLRDGRKLLGYLRSIDQFANLILEDVVERIFVGRFYCEIAQGFLLIRGENVELAGEVDENIPTNLMKVSVEELQRIEDEQSARSATNTPFTKTGDVSKLRSKPTDDDPFSV